MLNGKPGMPGRSGVPERRSIGRIGSSKKLLVLLIVVCMMISSGLYAYAAAGFGDYQKEAASLNALGLLKGTSTREFKPDLKGALTLETGVVMMIRLLGLETEADAMTDDEAAQALAGYGYADKTSAWAIKSMAYVSAKGIAGVAPDALPAPKTQMTGKQYTSMLMNALGYPITDDVLKDASKMVDMANQIGINIQDAVLFFTDEKLSRNELAGISCAFLSLRDKDGVTVLENLVKKGVVTQEQAQALNMTE